MFLFKKIVAPLFFPLSLCLEILILGIFFLWFTQRQKTAKIIVTIGVFFLISLSYGVALEAILHRLEYKYPPLTDVSAVSDIKLVVVLSGGYSPDAYLPVTDQLSKASLIRLVEGIRIHRMLSKSKLVLSGTGAYGVLNETKIMADAALALGVNAKDLILESASRDTKEQVRLIQQIVGDRRFVLVTSASHMLRSMVLFQKRGMRPIPAPIDYKIKERQKITPAMFFPSADRIDKMERAFYEYLGLVWLKLEDSFSRYTGKCE
jgi:uncharacterized SAM-binding protein YcdF (DUF218 family)